MIKGDKLLKLYSEYYKIKLYLVELNKKLEDTTNTIKKYEEELKHVENLINKEELK